MASLVDKGKVNGTDGTADTATTAKLISAQPTPESLKTAFKKRGHFDGMRKSALKRFTESDFKESFTESLTKLVTAETSRDPSLLTRDRTKARLLIEGAIERTDTYRVVEDRVQSLLNERRKELEDLVSAILEETTGVKKKKKKEENWDVDGVKEGVDVKRETNLALDTLKDADGDVKIEDRPSIPTEKIPEQVVGVLPMKMDVTKEAGTKISIEKNADASTDDKAQLTFNGVTGRSPSASETLSIKEEQGSKTPRGELKTPVEDTKSTKAEKIRKDEDTTMEQIPNRNAATLVSEKVLRRDDDIKREDRRKSINLDSEKSSAKVENRRFDAHELSAEKQQLQLEKGQERRPSKYERYRPDERERPREREFDDSYDRYRPGERERGRDLEDRYRPPRDREYERRPYDSYREYDRRHDDDRSRFRGYDREYDRRPYESYREHDRWHEDDRSRFREYRPRERSRNRSRDDERDIERGKEVDREKDVDRDRERDRRRRSRSYSRERDDFRRERGSRYP